MRLYEIADGLRAIEADIDDADGELTPEAEAALDGLEWALEIKADGIAVLIVEAEHRAEALKREAKRFADRQRVQENKARRLRGYLLAHVEARGPIEGRRFTIAARRNPIPSIRWASDTLPPPVEFQRLRIELDGEKARAAFKRGELPDGFHAAYGFHLRIK